MRDDIHMGRFRYLWIAGWIACLALPFYGPRWIGGLACFPNDLYIHYDWATFFSRRLAAGCLFPEWLPELFDGLGGGVFSYYPPGYFYLVGLAQMATGQIWLSMRAVEMLAVVAMGTMAFCHAENVLKVAGRWDRLLMAAAVACAPYWVANLSLAGGIPSFCSTALMVYALVRCERVSREGSALVDWRLALATGLIPWFHNLTMHMTLLAMAGALSFLAISGKRVRWKCIAASLALGVALGSGRTLVAFLHSGGINMGNLLLHVEIDWRANFATPIGLKTSWFVFQWPIAGFLVLGTATILGAWLRVGRGSASRPLAFWLGAALVSMFMASQWSWPLWAHCLPLQYFQFPTRFLQPASVAVAMGLASVIAEAGPGAGFRWFRMGGRLMLAMGLALSLMLSLKTLREGERVADRESTFLRMTSGQWEYLPPGQPTAWRGLVFSEPGQRLTLDGADIEVFAPTPCGGLRASIHKPTDGFQRLPAFAHPRWGVEIDGAPAIWQRDPDSGLMQVELPAGDSRVELVWRRGWSHWLALAGLAMLVMGLPIMSGLFRRGAANGQGGGS